MGYSQNYRPYWSLIILRHLICRGTKWDRNFGNDPHHLEPQTLKALKRIFRSKPWSLKALNLEPCTVNPEALFHPPSEYGAPLYGVVSSGNSGRTGLTKISLYLECMGAKIYGDSRVDRDYKCTAIMEIIMQSKALCCSYSKLKALARKFQEQTPKLNSLI